MLTEKSYSGPMCPLSCWLQRILLYKVLNGLFGLICLEECQYNIIWIARYLYFGSPSHFTRLWLTIPINILVLSSPSPRADHEHHFYDHYHGDHLDPRPHSHRDPRPPWLTFVFCIVFCISTGCWDMFENGTCIMMVMMMLMMMVMMMMLILMMMSMMIMMMMMMRLSPPSCNWLSGEGW